MEQPFATLADAIASVPSKVAAAIGGGAGRPGAASTPQARRSESAWYGSETGWASRSGATTVAQMDWTTVLDAIDEVLASHLGWADKAARVAALIQEAGRYRWVGLYAVAEEAITVIGWSGPGAPAHPRFPVTQGLNGAAVATKRAVVVNDVTADPRYLTAFASTRSEAVIPILDPGTGTVVGTVDVESSERAAFNDADRHALEGCAAALADLIAEARS
jgi:L-methionine (R)-S-oxide reductase